MDCLKFLYKTKIGRILLRPLISKPISSLSGAILDSRLSKLIIKSFASKNSINLDDYILDDINCFNDFFCRRIKKELRPIDMDETKLITPCDGLLKVFPINNKVVLPVKQSQYSIKDLLNDENLAEELEGGYCLVYRLCVNHYHRYAYFESGHKQKDVTLPGVYHTVRPIALENGPVFVQNSRVYSVIETAKLGRCVQMEVGAMLVGRIVNDNPEPCNVIRGEEKGHFEYGGSTIIVLIPKDKVIIDPKLLEASQLGEEVSVEMGQVIGDIKDK